jgi:arylsulfatase A-like enzyme
MVALRWNAKPNRFGIPGQILTDASRGAGQGSHATLGEFDVHNTLIAAGPDFRHAMVDDLPSGNIDLAPTVLHLLGLEPPHKFDGRVLSEAMTGESAPPRAVTETLEVTRKFSSGEWRQHLRISRVGETTYIDEGNGAFEASPTSSTSPTASP